MNKTENGLDNMKVCGVGVCCAPGSVVGHAWLKPRQTWAEQLRHWRALLRVHGVFHVGSHVLFYILVYT